LLVDNPVLVEALRGSVVESRHRGAIAVCDTEGAAYLTIGDVLTPVFPRSTAKPIQALPLVSSGAADHYGLTDQQLALACASHNGEAGHVAAIAAMLARADLDLTALECGAHWPLYQPAAHALVRAGASPTALHNNCSGQHAGFLCVAGQMAVDPRHYVEVDHPVQREASAALEAATGISLKAFATDGCSIPTYAVPLDRLACGFARLGTGHRLDPQRAAAARRLLDACMSHPWYLGGTARFCTTVIDRLKNRVLLKMGAEGVFGAALPELGFGIAVKCDDGGMRATEVIMATLLARLLPLSADDGAALEQLAWPAVRSCNNVEVGSLRPTAALTPDGSR
jgi:L-asparaginase II